MIPHSQDVNVCGCLPPAAQSLWSLNLNISSSLPGCVYGKATQGGFSRVMHQLGWPRGDVGILLILPDYLVDAALMDVPSSVHTTQRTYWEVYSVVLFVVFVPKSLCPSPCSFTVGWLTYSPSTVTSVFTLSEWRPASWWLVFQDLQRKTSLAGTRKGSRSGAVPGPQLSPLDPVSLSSPPSLASLGGYFPFRSLASP